MLIVCFISLSSQLGLMMDGNVPFCWVCMLQKSLHRVVAAQNVPAHAARLYIHGISVAPSTLLRLSEEPEAVPNILSEKLTAFESRPLHQSNPMQICISNL